MDLIVDVFNNDAFSVTEVGDSINVIPNQYGRIGELNIFPDKGIATTTVSIEQKNGVLNLLQTAQRGAPGTVGVKGKRSIRQLSTVHIPHDTQITADALRDIRGNDGKVGLKSAMEALNEELTDHRNKHDITREHLRAGALRGEIIDADGTVLLDIFSEFGVTETSVDFVLGTSTTDVQVKSLDVCRHIEDNLMGDTLTGVRGLCSKDFFDNLIAHDAVKEFWKNHNGKSNQLGEDPRKGFYFGGITYEEYRGSAPALNEDGSTTTRQLIPDGDVRFFPEGTKSTFRTYNAPSDFMSDIGKKGQPYYAKVDPDPKDRYLDVHSQQNLLPICHRPAVLVEGTSSN